MYHIPRNPFLFWGTVPQPLVTFRRSWASSASTVASRLSSLHLAVIMSVSSSSSSSSRRGARQLGRCRERKINTRFAVATPTVRLSVCLSVCRAALIADARLSIADRRHGNAGASRIN